ncbi:hypothetical protein [Dyadobacter sp. CY323]|uniref:hypothetical protein n=1 Tax=Dyadobacter sp. CY323 TaxID=2907302 RepID=UPI001F1AB066|nr:hypothetical protein [Dyadobacter sp. CY323]MCE6987491.1 hypothetical protein [Dyadobacter sp. CY323]
MKKLLNFAFVGLLAIVAAHIVPDILALSGLADPEFIGAVILSFAGLRNIEEQMANPAGIRRIGVIAVADLDPAVIDWPKAVGVAPDVDKLTMLVTTALPVSVGKTVSVIIPADNSAAYSFENQGDRYYQSYKHALSFDIAGLTKAQSVELRKFLNTGAIFFVESNDGDIRVIGSKLSPIVLKSKGDSGKKGGDKRGYALSGDNDNFVIEPPFYPDTLALPGMLEEE